MAIHTGRFKKTIEICKAIPFAAASDMQESIERELANEITLAISAMKHAGQTPKRILIHLEADYGEFTMEDNRAHD